MIPKIIHYVWVGDAPKSELVLRCIDSWKKKLPDYQIIEWNNDSLKLINNNYASEAFKKRKWAFVSDYLRLKALNEYGGFYFDTDLEILSDMSEFLDHSFISCFEYYKNSQVSPIVTACMGAEKGSRIIKDLLEIYDNKSFILPNGLLDQTTNTETVTEYLKNKFKLPSLLNHEQELVLSPGEIIFPSYYFCVPKIGEKSYAIHHFEGSWVEGYSRRILANIFQYKLYRTKKRSNSREDLYLDPEEKFLRHFTIGKKGWMITKKI